jgi:hypothetical protein
VEDSTVKGKSEGNLYMRAVNGKLFFIALLGALALFCSSMVLSAGAVDDAGDELKKMYELDQREREESKDPKADSWKVITKHDEERRKRVLELMQSDKLQSAEDYYRAAMIMQHGNKPNDYVLAHIFACASAQKGFRPAIWLSAASFDRMMQSMNQAQFFSTQYYSKDTEPYTVKEPKNTTLLTDSVRKAFNVPTLAETEERLKKWNDEIAAMKGK